MFSKPQFLNTSSGNVIAYHQTQGKTNKPGIVFLGGFMSDMQGSKACALEAFCQKNNLNFIRFDYVGHGQSSGQFTDGTIGLWKENVLSVLDQLTEGSQIVVGSSMGGWLMLLAALARPERIVGLLGIASAPDFTETLIWNALDETAKKQLQHGPHYLMKSDHGDNPYPITMDLIEDGRQHLLLHNTIPINVPIHLLHGANDKDVPAEISVTLSQKLTSDDVHLQLVPNADHRMSGKKEIALLCNTLKDMVEKYRETG